MRRNLYPAESGACGGSTRPLGVRRRRKNQESGVSRLRRAVGVRRGRAAERGGADRSLVLPGRCDRGKEGKKRRGGAEYHPHDTKIFRHAGIGQCPEV